MFCAISAVCWGTKQVIPDQVHALPSNTGANLQHHYGRLDLSNWITNEKRCEIVLFASVCPQWPFVLWWPHPVRRWYLWEPGALQRMCLARFISFLGFHVDFLCSTFCVGFILNLWLATEQNTNSCCYFTVQLLNLFEQFKWTWMNFACFKFVHQNFWNLLNQYTYHKHI